MCAVGTTVITIKVLICMRSLSSISHCSSLMSPSTLYHCPLSKVRQKIVKFRSFKVVLYSSVNSTEQINVANLSDTHQWCS